MSQQSAETFIRDSGSYSCDSITQVLQVWRLHIHDTNLLLDHILLYWTGNVWLLWTRCFRWSELWDTAGPPAGRRCTGQQQCSGGIYMITKSGDKENIITPPAPRVWTRTRARMEPRLQVMSQQSDGGRCGPPPSSFNVSHIQRRSSA